MGRANTGKCQHIRTNYAQNRACLYVHVHVYACSHTHREKIKYKWHSPIEGKGKFLYIELIYTGVNAY